MTNSLHLGMTVYYITAAVERYAAIVTAVDHPGDPESPLSLAVFQPDMIVFVHHVPYGSGPHTWQWPPWVDVRRPPTAV